MEPTKLRASELMIGNIFLEEIRGNKNEFIIAGINSLTNTVIDSNDSITSIDYLEPIPLTEEWLKRAGFEPYALNGWFQKEIKDDLSIHINTSMQVCLYAGQYIDGEGSHIESIQYIHQLQNLFFALTGSELTIKEQ